MVTCAPGAEIFIWCGTLPGMCSNVTGTEFRLSAAFDRRTTFSGRRPWSSRQRSIPP
jgi:hypothetical protein